MLDQSYNPNYLFLCRVVISDLYLFQEILMLNPCFRFYKKLMLSFIDKKTSGT